MVATSDIIIGKTTEHLAQLGEFAGILHLDVVKAFSDLVDEAKSEGFDLAVISGFRSFDRQLAIWNAKASGSRPVLDDQDYQVDMTCLNDLQKINAIMRFSALPGASRHHWGTDFDVYDAAAIQDGYEVQLLASETKGSGIFAELHRWLDSALPKTDFYRPYEYDNGGVSVEPWHLSYRPLSEKYERLLTPGSLLKALDGVEIELGDSIKANMPTIFEQFIKRA